MAKSANAAATGEGTGRERLRGFGRRSGGGVIEVDGPERVTGVVGWTGHMVCKQCLCGLLKLSWRVASQLEIHR